MSSIDVAGVVTSTFPEALPNEELVAKVSSILSTHGYTESNTLFTSVLCCDEVNRVLDKEFAKVYGDNFNLGGIVGFSFGGTLAYCAMGTHIPEGGKSLIVYGPHVGVDAAGQVGRLTRRGRNDSTTSCGSGEAALEYVQNAGPDQEHPLPEDEPIEVGHWLVTKYLLANKERLESSENAHAEVPKILFEEQTKLIYRIIEKGSSFLADGTTIALLGGIQVNTPPGVPDYFAPKLFQLLKYRGELLYLKWT